MLGEDCIERVLEIFSFFFEFLAEYGLVYVYKEII